MSNRKNKKQKLVPGVDGGMGWSSLIQQGLTVCKLKTHALDQEVSVSHSSKNCQCVILIVFLTEAFPELQDQLWCWLVHNLTDCWECSPFSFLCACWVFWFGLSFFFFLDMVSLCLPGCPRTHSVEQADLEPRDLPASGSWVPGLKVCSIINQKCVAQPSLRLMILLPLPASANPTSMCHYNQLVSFLRQGLM